MQYELIDSNMFGYQNFYPQDAPCTNAANHIKDWDNNWITKKCVTHEVIAIDRTNNYAIIQHNIYRTRACEVCLRVDVSLSHPYQYEIPYSTSYILCGINSDDEMYFLHPLGIVPEELIYKAKNHSDVMSVVKWCNKEDMGFEGRIQGDIIFAEVEPRILEILAHKDYIDEVIYEFTIRNTKMRIALSLHTHPEKKFMARDWQHDLMSLVNYIKTHSEQQDITIGNSHKVKTDGIITTILNEQLPSEIDRWSPVDIFSTAVILGSELMIRHPEHPTVKKHIPADKALLLSMQRGSSPSIQGWSD